MPKKHTYEYVYNYFKNEGCELLETEYVGALTKMKYKCSCENISEIKFSKFQNGCRCAKCGGTEKLTYEYVYNYFKEQKCELLETEYINSATKMRYRCECGEESLITFANFQKGRKCRKCSFKRASAKIKHSYYYVYNYFKENNCELLESEYINNKTKMKFKCRCGNESLIRFSDFKRVCRCKDCFYNNNTGENNSRWNKNREELSIHDRIRIRHNKSWIKKYMKNDPNYNQYLINPKEYHIDHIIPVSIFSKFVFYYNLNEQLIKKIINKIENLQILPAKENMTKKAKGSIFEAAQYLMLNGIKLT